MQHPNARLTPRGRRELVRLVEGGATLRAGGGGVRRGGLDGVRLGAALARCGDRRAGLAGMSARPLEPAGRESAALLGELEERICAARRGDWLGAAADRRRAACRTRRSGRCCSRHGCSARPRPPREPANRYEWPCPGDLLHMDVSRYARFTRPGHAVTGDRSSTSAEKRERSATSTPTRSSTTTPAWPTSSCTPTSAPTPSSRLPSARSPGTPSTASRPSA